MIENMNFLKNQNEVETNKNEIDQKSLLELKIKQVEDLIKDTTDTEELKEMWDKLHQLQDEVLALDNGEVGEVEDEVKKELEKKIRETEELIKENPTAELWRKHSELREKLLDLNDKDNLELDKAA